MFLLQILFFIVIFLSLILWASVFNANHQRKPIPSHCATCQYVECLFLLLSLILLMSLVDLMVHGSTSLSENSRWDVDNVKLGSCIYDVTIDFPCEDFFWTLNPNLGTLVSSLKHLLHISWQIQSTSVGNSQGAEYVQVHALLMVKVTAC